MYWSLRTWEIALWREYDTLVMIALVVLEAGKQCLDLLCGQMMTLQEATTRA